MVDHERTAALQRVIAAVQRRWGERVLRVFGHTTPPAVAVVSTGFAELDTVLGSGGLPRGSISELLGLPSSGMTTIALRALAAAQARGDCVGYIDPHATFDPEYAAWRGVDLASLVLVRPRQLADVPDLIFALVKSGGLGVLVVDDLIALQEQPPGTVFLHRALRVLPGALARSARALVVLTRLPYQPQVIRAIGAHGSGRGTRRRAAAARRARGLAGQPPIVWDIVRFARTHGIRCQGRGSAANSLVAYVLGISPIDPLAHDLVFERFL